MKQFVCQTTESVKQTAVSWVSSIFKILFESLLIADTKECRIIEINVSQLRRKDSTTMQLFDYLSTFENQIIGIFSSAVKFISFLLGSSNSTS